MQSNISKENTHFLTPFEPGSLREIWTLAYPLMLSAISGALMTFFDRLFLANYSSIAMNAVISCSLVVYIFYVGTSGVAGIAEVYVGRHNGAKEFNQIGSPVWQMIWFAILTSFISVPVALYGSKLLILESYEADGIPYFKTIMLGAPLSPLFAALISFYVGRGKVKLITIVSILGNLLNIFLDYILIFGFGSFIPPLGSFGAALATVIGQFFQVLVLFLVFLSPKNIKRFGTLNYKLNFKLFIKCFKIGLPNAIGHMIEISAWALQFYILGFAGHIYVTIAGIGQSVFVLFAFASQGLQKAVISAASNYVGANQADYVYGVIKSSIKLMLLITLVMAFPLVIYPDLIIKGFLAGETLAEETIILNIFAKEVLFCVWIYLLLDGLVWVFAGVLTAGGDTKFTMVVNAINAWLFALVPTYLCVITFQASPVAAWRVLLLYATVNVLCFYLRYKSNSWKKDIQQLI